MVAVVSTRRMSNEDIRHSKVMERLCDRIRCNDPSLNELHLPFKLTDDDVTDLIAAMRNTNNNNNNRRQNNNNTHIESLNLNHNTKMTNKDRELRALIEACLSYLPNLRKLSMSHMKLTNEHAQWIGQVLRHHHHQQHQQQGTSDTTGTTTTTTGLKELVLRSNDIGCKGAESLVKGLLHHDDNNTTCSTLEKLDLAENQINSSGCQVLASYASSPQSVLKVLDLSSNRICDAGAQAIARGLFVVGVGGNGNNNNNSSSSSACCCCCSLTHLSLNNNGICDKGVRALAMALRQNNSLIELSLYNNLFTGIGGVSELESSLGTINYSMEMVYFDWNDRVSIAQRDRIRTCCRKNVQTKRVADRFEKKDVFDIPLSLWPKALERVSSKPDLLFAALKSKPEIMRNGGAGASVGRSTSKKKQMMKKLATAAVDVNCSCSIL